MKEVSPWRIQQLADNVEDREYVYSPQTEEPHLRDYWKMLVKRRRVAILVFLVVFGFGVYIISSATPMYTASATIKIEPQNPMIINIQEVLNLQATGGGTYDYYKTQFALLKSRALAAKVISELGLESNRAFTSIPVVSPSPFQWLRSQLFGSFQSFLSYVSQLVRPEPKQKKEPRPLRMKETSRLKEKPKKKVNPHFIGRYLAFLEVEQVPQTRLVRVRFTTPDPYLSQKMANAHAAAFIRMNLETRFALNKEARKYLEEKLSELKARVEQAESKLSDFRKQHRVVSPAGSESIIIDRLVDINNHLTQSRVRRIEIESLHEMLKNRKLQNLSEIIDNNMIQMHKTRIETLEAEQVRLSGIFKPEHPRMLDLAKEIRESRQRLNLEVAEIVRRIESDYAAAQEREESLKIEAERQKEAALHLKELGVKYAILQGEVDSNRTLYKGVLARLNETNISNDLPVSNMQITEMADRPGGLSSRSEQLKLLLAITGGAVFLAVGLAFCLAYFDSTVRTPEDVWRVVFAPTFGVVPHLSFLRRRTYGFRRLGIASFARRLVHPRPTTDNSFSRDLMISHHPFSIISESYRNIRTALLLSQAEQPPQVILLTSPCSGEGKTVTTLNLGVALAQGGRSVLVIDADLRKGSCHTQLKQQNHRGLTEILTGTLDLREAVRETKVPGLFLLSRGKIPPNPPDLLGALKMKEIVDVLRGRFDFILIDSPPVIAVTDAVVLSKLCDGALLVLRGQDTTVGSARQATERLEAVRARVLGVVLNAVDINDPEYIDYRHYYASYYASANEQADDTGKGDHRNDKNGGPKSGVIEDPPLEAVEEPPGPNKAHRDTKSEVQVEGVNVPDGSKAQVSEVKAKEDGNVIKSRDEAFRTLKVNPPEGFKMQASKAGVKAAKIIKTRDETVREFVDKTLQALSDLGSRSLARFAVGAFLAILCFSAVASLAMQNKDHLRGLGFQAETVLSFVGERLEILKQSLDGLFVVPTSEEAGVKKAVAVADGVKPVSSSYVLEAAVAETEASSHVETPLSFSENENRQVVVKQGSTIYGVASDIYGANSVLLGLSLIKEFNTHVEDLNSVSVGEDLWFPPLTQETLLRRQPDGSYRLIIASFSNSARAAMLAQAVRQKGYEGVVTPQRISDNVLLHRVEVERLEDLRAVDRAWNAAVANQWLPFSKGRPSS